ncbi:zinc finger protein [Saccharothrix carnea]|uniref:zinc finger protein n=1 Tax=Saccharothrix carnea TaxID=1280637 RepID=UPI000D0DF40D|nr:zinc finger protein [Saccharothrix carnea]
MGTRAFRWLPYHGQRHAIPDALAANDEGETLCGVSVTVPHDPPPRCPDGCWPTCRACDAAWREHEGIPLFPWPRHADDHQPVGTKVPRGVAGRQS